MFQTLLALRRWCFLYYQNTQNRAYASSQYKWTFGAILVPFYLIPILVQAELGYKLGWKPLLTRGNSMHMLMNGILLFAPLVLLIWWFLGKAQQVEPLASIVNKGEGKLGLRLVLTGLIGFGLLLLFVVSLEAFLPVFR